MRVAVLLLLAQAPAPISTADLQPVPAAEALRRFDHHRVEIRRMDDRWQLTANGEPLKEFPRESEARQALKLVQDFRMNQYGSIGSPTPILEYWLADGAAPRGIVRGLQLTAFNPDAVRAVEVQKQWVVRDDRQVLFVFGPQEQEAHQTAAIIRKYGFNQVGFVGNTTPSMMYFLVHHSNKDAVEVVRPTSGATAVKEPPKLPGAGLGKQPTRLQPVANAGLSLNRQLANPLANAAAAGPLPVDRIPFDWRTVQLKHDNQEWKLVSGKHVLGNFGRNERDARVALAVVQRFRFSEQCLLGKPKPTCSYYLVQGQPPRGTHIGVASVTFRPESLTVQEKDANFQIVEGPRAVMHFGQDEQTARQVLQVIQHHKFDHWCHIGRPGQGGMTFFTRTR